MQRKPESSGRVVGHSHVWVARYVSDHLQRLADCFQLVWCTAWEDHAAEFLAPYLGLPALPVISFDEPIGDDGHWKWPAIETFVGDRPFAWIDDELGRDDFARAERRSSADAARLIEGTHGLVRRARGSTRAMEPRGHGMSSPSSVA